MKDVCLPDVLAGRLGYLLKHAYVGIAGAMEEALAPFSLLPRELAVMSVIDAAREQPSQLEIAAQIGMDRTTMVGVIDSLEKKGYVERRRSDRDRRRNVVTLTPEGQTCLREADQARERVERDFLALLDADSARALTEALRTIYCARKAAGRILSAGHLHCGRPT
jgi:DNA-binding MarR family transcriptional regulator